MSINNTSALITDIERRKALPIIRSLGRKGVRIIGISSYRMPMCRLSKYITAFYKCPNYHERPNQFLDFLEKICRKTRPDVFYPLEDAVLQLCVQNPDSWRTYTNALVPPAKILDAAYDKWKTVQFAQNIGISVPKTICPKSLDEVRELYLKWSGPAVIKPRKSSGSRGLRYVENPAELLSVYHNVSNIYKRPLIQDRIPKDGAGLGVFVLSNHKSQPLAVFGHKRLREYPISGGPSTLRVSYRDDDLIHQSIRLFQQMGLVGVAMAEYKYDARINKPVLMEVNARFWGSLQLAISAGVDFPALYHRAVLGIKFDPVLEYLSGIYCRWLVPGDILHFLQNPDRFHLEPNFFKFRGKRISYDILSVEDPLPVVGILVESFRKLKNRHFSNPKMP